jgi:acyl dehydratase
MDLEALRTYSIKSIERSYAERDTILYALGLGYGDPPTDLDALRFVYEKSLQTVPSYCTVLGSPDFWLQDPILKINWRKIVHGEQRFRIHRVLPPAGTVKATFRILGVDDKGSTTGAVLAFEKTLFDVDGTLLAEATNTLFLRGDGGYGGFGEVPAVPGPLGPDRFDRAVDVPTLPQLALIYRLNGDLNPLHCDPELARSAGFERPILHGLCALGIACRALIQTYCAGNADRLQSMFVRFSRPVYPGETIRLESYTDNGCVRFRARVLERDVLILDRGQAMLL